MIPKTLQNQKLWIRFNKKKIPLNPITGHPATGSEFINTRTDYKTAINSKHGIGVGFIITSDSDYAFIDIDLPINDPESIKWIDYFDSYTEKSINGNTHIIIKAQPIKSNSFTTKSTDKKHELYFRGRFIAFTGDSLEGKEIIRSVPQKKLMEYCREVGHFKNEHQKKDKNTFPIEQIFDTHAEQITLNDITEKTIVYCPFHKDNNPSAFLDKNENGLWFLYCSTCGKTFWQDSTLNIQEWLSGALKYDSKFIINNIHILSETDYELNRQQIAKKLKVRPKFLDKKFAKRFKLSNTLMANYEKFIWNKELYIVQEETNSILNATKAIDNASYQIIFNELLEQNRVFNEKDLTFETLTTHLDDLPNFVFLPEQKLRLYFPINNSEHSETEKTLKLFSVMFGEYLDFILDWLSVYVCRNHVEMPTIILISDRGRGKDTFCDFIQAIFPKKLSISLQELPNNFTEYYDKKLLILNEFKGRTSQLYRTMKKLQGQKYLRVRNLYMPPYEVENNLKVIIATNEKRPIYVHQHEMPESDDQNPWFIFDLNRTIHPFKYPLTKKEIDLVIKSAPNFCREFLIPRYKKIEKRKNFGATRWTPTAPITEDLKILFTESIGSRQYTAAQVLEEILNTKTVDGVRETNAITQQMIDEALSTNRVQKINTEKFNSVTIKKALQDFKYIETKKTSRCTSVNRMGYKIIALPNQENPEIAKEYNLMKNKLKTDISYDEFEQAIFDQLEKGEKFEKAIKAVKKLFELF